MIAKLTDDVMSTERSDHSWTNSQDLWRVESEGDGFTRGGKLG